MTRVHLAASNQRIKREADSHCQRSHTHGLLYTKEAHESGTRTNKEKPENNQGSHWQYGKDKYGQSNHSYGKQNERRPYPGHPKRTHHVFTSRICFTSPTYCRICRSRVL